MPPGRPCQLAAGQCLEVAYFLQTLDREDCREPNGGTILENSLITISTESGDGRHNDVQRELSGVFHAVTGAGGRFKTGLFLDVGAEGSLGGDRPCSIRGRAVSSRPTLG